MINFEFQILSVFVPAKIPFLLDHFPTFFFCREKRRDPKTHREHYNHKSDAIKASSSYLLRDALVPVRERESYKHPVLGENIFDFERKVEKTENPFAKEALQDKIKEMQ